MPTARPGRAEVGGQAELAEDITGPPGSGLAGRAAQGDQVAFEQLVREHQDRMLAICRRVTCHDQDALDALQDALIAAWRHIGRFRGQAQVSTWLYRIAVNAALDVVHDRKRHPSAPAPEARLAADGPSFEDTVVARMAIDWALAQLPPRYRAAVVLREYAGCSYQEIATILNIPVDTVKSRISRGRQALADLLGLRPRADRGQL